MSWMPPLRENCAVPLWLLSCAALQEPKITKASSLGGVEEPPPSPARLSLAISRPPPPPRREGLR